jgi:hypothetical protein
LRWNFTIPETDINYVDRIYKSINLERCLFLDNGYLLSKAEYGRYPVPYKLYLRRLFWQARGPESPAVVKYICYQADLGMVSLFSESPQVIVLLGAALMLS